MSREAFFDFWPLEWGLLGWEADPSLDLLRFLGIIGQIEMGSLISPQSKFSLAFPILNRSYAGLKGPLGVVSWDLLSLEGEGWAEIFLPCLSICFFRETRTFHVCPFAFFVKQGPKVRKHLPRLPANSGYLPRHFRFHQHSLVVLRHLLFHQISPVFSCGKDRISIYGQHNCRRSTENWCHHIELLGPYHQSVIASQWVLQS